MKNFANRVIVAIPARNEAKRIGRCLDALAIQTNVGSFGVVVLANGCADNTVAIARAHGLLDINVVEHDFPDECGNAGEARHLAMEIAAQQGDLILATDADCVPDRDWISAICLAFDANADAVAGRVSADWSELQHHPEGALAIGALEWEYLHLIGEAEAQFDPQPHDPKPRHAQRCGANMAITRQMLERVGGVPRIATGEDRALFAAVERVDGKVRQDPKPHVIASARIEGRAGGGMADALKARTSPDYRCDEQFAPADRLIDLWIARRAGREAWASGNMEVAVAGKTFALKSQYMYFGLAWHEIEKEVFLDKPIQPHNIPSEIARMRARMAAHA